MLFTSVVSFFAYAIIPDNVRPQYFDNLISGIAINLAGPTPLKLGFQAFIVIVRFLMLARAINTAIVGANGVLNRVSEDGVIRLRSSPSLRTLYKPLTPSLRLPF